MDYGKLAYLRVEELEARGAGKPRVYPASAGFSPGVRLNVPYTVAEMRCGGGAAFAVRCELKGEGDGRLVLTVGGRAAAECGVNFSGRTSAMLLGSADADGLLAVSPENLGKAVLERVEILTVGGGVGRENADFAVAGGGPYAVAYGESADIAACLFSDGVFGPRTILGRGQSFDLCFGGDGYYLAHNDPLGNLWLKKFDTALQPLTAVCLGAAAPSPTVCAYDRVYVAAAGADCLFVRTADRSLTAVGPPVRVTGGAERVRFVRGAPRPTLAVESGGRCFLRSAIEDERTAGGVAAAFALTAEGSDVGA